ncbi:unnamed protein product [Triticum turgidum subsp. durum]|uniref:PGG domain-containing protein n=1 Tax=Triticum turgidum subsp. durum TaxID=4567 RepID=A0A9R1QZT3_TRITD|nr:unnamed protein product [Triticum turgidum subsp. durum]
MTDIASSSAQAQQQQEPPMAEELLKAATCGETDTMRMLIPAFSDPETTPVFMASDLGGTTPAGNTCVHISCIHGHIVFCMLALQVDQSLLSKVNHEGETPLVIAAAHGHANLASLLLKRCNDLGLQDTILCHDKDKSNALHHAIRNGSMDLAIQLLEAAPALSRHVNIYRESPMFMAVMRGFRDIALQLLEIYDSSHAGGFCRHALHAAAKNGDQVIAAEIMKKRPQLARIADSNEDTPIRLAVCYNKVGVLREFLQHDISLGYEVNNQGFTLLTSAATRGHVGVARELLNHCPDAPYRHVHHQELTCLHSAVQNGHTKFIEFILQTPQLQRLVNMQDSSGRTALHYAVERCNPRTVAALLSCKGIDTTIFDTHGESAASLLSGITSHEKNLDWKEVQVLMLKADPKDDDIPSDNLHKEVEQQETIESIKERKSTTQRYTTNTSLVAILLATITFTAAFTLPGGYSSDPGSEGIPIMSKKAAFQAFLIFDTLAMCSAFVVAVICLMGRWEDDRFTSYYITVTKRLTWFAYMATLAAFAAGLYTVLSSRRHWMAIGICLLVGFCPCLTWLISKWPILKLNYRLGRRWFSMLFGDYRVRQPSSSVFRDMV